MTPIRYKTEPDMFLNAKLQLSQKRPTPHEVIRIPTYSKRGKPRSWANKGGFTLIELLVSFLVSGVLLLGISNFYISTIHFYEQSSSQTFLQRQGTLIIDEMTRRIRFANGLIQDPPDCPATPSLKVTQPSVAGFYCFYQSVTGNQLLERLPDESDFNLLSGSPVPLTVSNVVFTAVGGQRVTIRFQVNDERSNSMTFETDLVTRN